MKQDGKIRAKKLLASAVMLVTIALSHPVAAQTYNPAGTNSYGTNSPAQQAIWRNAMNAAVRRQAFGSHAHAHAPRQGNRHNHRPR